MIYLFNAKIIFLYLILIYLNLYLLLINFFYLQIFNLT